MTVEADAVTVEAGAVTVEAGAVTVEAGAVLAEAVFVTVEAGAVTTRKLVHAMILGAWLNIPVTAEAVIVTKRRY